MGAHCPDLFFLFNFHPGILGRTYDTNENHGNAPLRNINAFN